MVSMLKQSFSYLLDMYGRYRTSPSPICWICMVSMLKQNQSFSYLLWIGRMVGDAFRK